MSVPVAVLPDYLFPSSLLVNLLSLGGNGGAGDGAYCHGLQLTACAVWKTAVGRSSSSE